MFVAVLLRPLDRLLHRCLLELLGVLLDDSQRLLVHSLIEDTLRYPPLSLLPCGRFATRSRPASSITLLPSFPFGRLLLRLLNEMRSGMQSIHGRGVPSRIPELLLQRCDRCGQRVSRLTRSASDLFRRVLNLVGKDDVEAHLVHNLRHRVLFMLLEHGTFQYLLAGRPCRPVAPSLICAGTACVRQPAGRSG